MKDNRDRDDGDPELRVLIEEFGDRIDHAELAREWHRERQWILMQIAKARRRAILRTIARAVVVIGFVALLVWLIVYERDLRFANP